MRSHRSLASADVMGDEEHRDAGILLEVLEQVHDLRLHADVEGGGRLIQDQQSGSSASAVAMTTRWRCPPLSSWG